MHSARSLARRSIALVAALALSGTLCATAYAEEPGTPAETTAPAEPTAPEAGEPTPPSTEPSTPDVPPAPVPDPDPVPVPDAAPGVPDINAGVADPGITVKVDGGPYLVGQTFPVEITVTNHGDAAATGVRAFTQTVSGSFVAVNGLGVLGTAPGASIPAGEKVVVVAEGRAFSWQGPPVTRFSISSNGDRSYENNNFDVAVPLTAPDSRRGSVSGLVYGDANGNGAADAGEGLQGVEVTLSAEGQPVRVRTGADGWYRAADLPLRTYWVSAGDAPGGWVLPTYQYLDVDGDEVLDFRGVRPLSDQLEASVDFTEDTYAVGQTARITVVLTNKGSQDISGVKAACDRSGEGPHVVDMAIGDLAWNRPGVTVPAGGSLTLTVTGVVPAKAAGYAAVYVACDFGPGDGPVGYPADQDVARVPGAANGDTWGVLYHDRDEDLTADADELLAGVKVAAIDRISGRLVAKATTNAEGRVDFIDLPAGPYDLKLYGPWKFEHGQGGFTIGTCAFCGGGWYLNVVPGPDVLDTDPVPPTTDPTPTTPTTSTTPPAGGGGGAGGAGDGGLADTGVNAVGLMAFGLLSLVVGIGAVVVARGRRAA
ncbi:MAG TPA: hypothetical protein VNO31_48840 [Umezawaea sp.]|nr:hypothetical protein [Umezawaea sp.]